MSSPTEYADLELLRGPLTVYCYRMLGGSGETDDAVQETLVRAWRNLDRFEPHRSRLSTWTHRIAHNVCVDMLRGAQRRALSMDMSPAAKAGDPLGTPLSADRFVEPMPDGRIITATDPGEIIAERQAVRLAFVAALQHLTPYQRSALILRDVLHFSAAEAAVVLECSAAAVNSAVQRARRQLATVNPAPTDLYDPADPDQRDLLDRYVRAFESHDVDGLIAVLRDDATTTMPPFVWWLRGGRTIAELMAFSDSCAGARLIPTVINGSPGFGQYRQDDDGGHSPFALVQVDIAGGTISGLVTFLGTADRFVEFGLPTRLPENYTPGTR